MDNVDTRTYRVTNYNSILSVIFNLLFVLGMIIKIITSPATALIDIIAFLVKKLLGLMMMTTVRSADRDRRRERTD